MREKLLDLVLHNGDLPPLSQILKKLVELANDPDSDVNSVVDLVETESVISGRLIHLANSVLFSGGRDPAHDISEAISRLGIKNSLDLVYSLELPKSFKKSQNLNPLTFWKHSFGVAYLTQIFARETIKTWEELEASYLSGLLHDVGILVFDYLIPDEYGEFLKENKDSSEHSLDQLEMKQFGITHQELGSKFIQKWWNLSPHVVKAVNQHHDNIPENLEKISLSQVVYLANKICNSAEISHNLIHNYSEPIEDNWLKVLDVSNEKLNKLLEDTREAIVAGELALS